LIYCHHYHHQQEQHQHHQQRLFYLISICEDLEIRALLSYYAASSGIFTPTFRDNPVINVSLSPRHGASSDCGWTNGL
jgi:hypothetical protein